MLIYCMLIVLKEYLIKVKSFLSVEACQIEVGKLVKFGSDGYKIK